MARLWSYEKRQLLQDLLAEGYKVTRIAQLMGISPGAIYHELQKTLSADEYHERQFIRYTAEAALKKDIERIKGGGDE